MTWKSRDETWIMDFYHSIEKCSNRKFNNERWWCGQCGLWSLSVDGRKRNKKMFDDLLIFVVKFYFLNFSYIFFWTGWEFERSTRLVLFEFFNEMWDTHTHRNLKSRDIHESEFDIAKHSTSENQKVLSKQFEKMILTHKMSARRRYMHCRLWTLFWLNVDMRDKRSRETSRRAEERTKIYAATTESRRRRRSRVLPLRQFGRTFWL